MDDRELLELAAKAAGLKIEFCELAGFYWLDSKYSGLWWDPLHVDGDAFRLAVELKLRVEVFSAESEVSNGLLNDITVTEYDTRSDRCAATRRAIVRCAAEIGKLMP